MRSSFGGRYVELWQRAVKLARATSRSFQTKRFSKCAICGNLRFGGRAAVSGVRRMRRSHSVVLGLPVGLDGGTLRSTTHHTRHARHNILSADLLARGAVRSI